MADLLRDRLQSTLGTAYTLERELGGGGMSRVFVARDEALGRDVVVKVLAPELTEGLSAGRFAREIRLAAALQEPHIVPVLTAGATADGLPYYTMPFVRGESLRARLGRGAVPLAEAVAILRDLATALEYAHANGIVHRDIKPENVLLSGRTAVVTDFGIAKALSASRTHGGAARDTLTQLGTSLGTPAYMAPEQAAGDPDVDARADVYAWGLVAYEVLGGAHPFAGRRTAQALLVAHLTEAPAPLATRAPDVSPALAALVARCLAKDPAERPADGGAVVCALDALHAGALGPGSPAALPGRGEADASSVSGPAGASRSHTPLPPDEGASIAVLPFANMSADPENEFFSDGITEDVIGALTRLPGLRVAARTSAFAFKGRDAELSMIGTKLGVRTVLQGSVRRAGNRVRVTAQLMDAHAGHQLWSERFDRELEDIFAVQDEIARRIVEHLELTLGLGASAPLVVRPTDDLEAYQLYLRAREAIHQRTHESLLRGIQFLRQALARDPEYGRAQLGLAEAYMGLGVYQYIPPGEARHETEAALAAAEQTDPALAALPFFRAQLKLYLRSDWRTAGDDLREALARQPQDALTHVYAAFWSGLVGQRVARDAAVKRALILDPLSPFVHAIAGMSCFVSGDYSEALALYDAGLALDPNSMVNLWQSAAALHRLGRLDEAVRCDTRAVELGRRSPIMLCILGQLLAADGQEAAARAIRDEIDARAMHGYVSPAARLVLDIALGDEDRIETSLRRNIEAGTGVPSFLTILVEDLPRLRAHPRLGPLVEQLAPYAEAPG
jgi:serine/threonine-protein kinase